MIYHFRLTTGRKDFFLREYHLLSTDTLYDFHRFIQSDMDFDDSQMASFFAVDKKSVQRQLSLFDTGDGAMDSINLEHLVKNKFRQIRYMFDFFHKRSLLIEFLGEVEQLPRKSYPIVVEAKGEKPDQFEEKPLPEPIPEIVSALDKKTGKKDLVTESLNLDDEIDLDDEMDEDNDMEEDDEMEDGYDISDLEMLGR